MDDEIKEIKLHLEYLKKILMLVIIEIEEYEKKETTAK